MAESAKLSGETNWREWTPKKLAESHLNYRENEISSRYKTMLEGSNNKEWAAEQQNLQQKEMEEVDLARQKVDDGDRLYIQDLSTKEKFRREELEKDEQQKV